MNEDKLMNSLNIAIRKADEGRALYLLQLINQLLDEFQEVSVDFEDEKAELNLVAQKLLLLNPDHDQVNEENLRRMVSYLTLDEIYREQVPQAALREEVDTLKNQLKDADNKMDEMTRKLARQKKEYEHQLQSLKAEYTSLIEQLKAEHASLVTQLKAENAALTKEAERLRKELANVSNPTPVNDGYQIICELLPKLTTEEVVDLMPVFLDEFELREAALG